MGDIVVTAWLENTCDRGSFERGYSDASAIRATSVEAIMDTGAAMLMLPATVVERLGLEARRRAMVTDADGGREMRPIAGPVTVEICGRSAYTSCVVGPPMSAASVGRSLLLELDLIAGGHEPGLYPRHPEHPILRV